MKDSVIAGTGNSRYLRTSISADTTWEDALTMLRAGTFPIDLAGINLAGFTTLGTALNSDTLLKSAVITALGLGADATPSDAWEAVLALIDAKADEDVVVTALSYNASTKTLTATINGASVTVATFNFTTPQEAAAVAPVQSVAGRTGDVTLTKSDVGLGNVDNTSDADKPISTATQTALNAKQDTLTFDTTPTSGSTNPVTSGGVYTEVSQLKSEISDVRNNSDVFLYGVKWDRLTNQLTRTFQAAGITTDTTNFCHKGSLNPNYDNPFDKIYPWSEMVVCNVDLVKYRSGNYSLKDCITAVYGDPDFTYVGTADLFVGRYRPKFWYANSEDADGNVYFTISQVERDGFIYSPEAIDGISFCIDAGNSKVTAGAGVPLTNITASTIHSRAKSSGFALQDIYTIDAQIALYLVEYANMNSQAAIGYGCSSCYRQNSDTIVNVSTADGHTSFTVSGSLTGIAYVGAMASFGASAGGTTYKGIVQSVSVSGSDYTFTLDRELAITDGMYFSIFGFTACEFDLTAEAIGNASGYIGTNEKANAFYRGALLYANRYSYILGVYRQSGTNHIWLCPKNLDPNDYDALNTSVHIDTGVALPELSADAWQTVGGNAQIVPGLGAFLVTGASSGSSSSPVGDQQYVPVPSTGSTILLFGCFAHDGWSCGVFGGRWLGVAGISYWNFAGLPILK